MKLEGDSKDYEVITRAIQHIPNNVNGLTCEIGLRRGGGTKYIIDALSKRTCPTKVHVAVDPYGDLVYAGKEGVLKRYDYTNKMRDETIGSVYQYAMSKSINFIFINLDDIEFFCRYANGVPVYSSEKEILEQYIFVHFDGPHHYEPILDEFVWFNDRMGKGSTIVFDDVLAYDHDKLETVVFEQGWKLIEKTARKASYQKDV